MAKDDLLFHAGHRERLRQKFLDGKLADYELLELMLGYVIPRRDVRPLSRMLLNKFGCLSRIFTAPIESLTKINGIGRNTAIFIKVVREIMLENYKRVFANDTIFHNETLLENYCRLAVDGKSVEELHVMYLDGDKRLLDDEVHSTGTINTTAIYDREIVRRALDVSARYVILFHNHPLPNRSFSDEDIEATRQLQKLLEPIGIALYDHYVVSRGVIYSMRNMHLLK